MTLRECIIQAELSLSAGRYQRAFAYLEDCLEVLDNSREVVEKVTTNFPLNEHGLPHYKVESHKARAVLDD